MKITHGKIVITDVPGIDEIVIDKSGPFDTHLITIYAYDAMSAWEIGPLTQLRDALTAAIDIVNSEGATNDTNTMNGKHVSRVFAKGDECPDDLMKVTDMDGDIWNRRHGMWNMGDGSNDGWDWELLLNAWGPLTEV